MADDQKFYPNQSDFTSHDQWNAHRVAFDHIYDLQDQVAQLKGHVETLKSAPAAGASGTGPSNTHIGGIAVIGAPPQDGQTLKYNSKTGQIEWVT